MTTRLAQIWRHPVKAIGREALDEVTLAPGAWLPQDRVWAIADEAAKIEPGESKWVRCVNFSRGAKSPALMAIRARPPEWFSTRSQTGCMPCS